MRYGHRSMKWETVYVLPFPRKGTRQCVRDIGSHRSGGFGDESVDGGLRATTNRSGMTTRTRRQRSRNEEAERSEEEKRKVFWRVAGRNYQLRGWRGGRGGPRRGRGSAERQQRRRVNIFQKLPPPVKFPGDCRNFRALVDCPWTIVCIDLLLLLLQEGTCSQILEAHPKTGLRSRSGRGLFHTPVPPQKPHAHLDCCV